MHSQRRIGDIEALRAFAIVLVFLTHFQSNVAGWSAGWRKFASTYFNGGVGVDLFFVISGFVIGRSMLGKLEVARTEGRYWREVVAFWLRRAWRLLPSAWIWLVIPLALAAFYNESGAFGTVLGNVRASLAGFFHVANFYFHWAFSQRDPELQNSVFVYWSLSLEEQFYLALPVIVFLAGKRLRWALGLMILGPLFLGRDELGIWHVRRAECLFLGVLLALSQVSGRAARFHPRWLSAGVPRALFVFSCLLLLPVIASGFLGFYTRKFCVPLLSLGLVWVASYDAGYVVRSTRLQRGTAWLGARSYALYLIHVPAFAFVRETFHRFSAQAPMDSRSGGWIAAYLTAAAVLPFLVADLSYRLLEVPLRTRGRRISAQYLDRHRQRESTGS